MELNKVIRDLRTQNGYTQQQIADALFIEPSTLSQYESGNRKLINPIVLDILNFFGCRLNVEYLKNDLPFTENVSSYNDNGPWIYNLGETIKLLDWLDEYDIRQNDLFKVVSREKDDEDCQYYVVKNLRDNVLYDALPVDMMNMLNCSR